MDKYKIIKEPIVSEKATDLTEKFNQYVFKVDRRANKHQIKQSIEKIYENIGVKVVAVKTMQIPGKPKRVRMREGRTSTWKKAIVTLKEGCKIDLQG